MMWNIGGYALVALVVDASAARGARIGNYAELFLELSQHRHESLLQDACPDAFTCAPANHLQR
eukprot:3884053-Pyramimonas_sp.AAC.1